MLTAADSGPVLVGWGAGGFFRRLTADGTIALDHLVDGSSGKWGSTVGHFVVEDPRKLLPQLDPSRTAIIIYSDFVDEIRRELQEIGPFNAIAVQNLISDQVRMSDVGQYIKQTQFFSAYGIDQKLYDSLNYRNGFFVELGANDGISESNTLFFEKNLGWKGVLIEPIPHKYLSCLKHRSKENKIFCAACVPHDYDKEFVKLIYSNLMSIAPELDTDVGNATEHARKGERFLPEHEQNFVFGAVARTLNSILIDADAPPIIDLLSLDVEGNELDVLKGLDLNSFKFRNIVVESRSVQRIEEHLSQYGMRLVSALSGHDFLFQPNEPV